MIDVILDFINIKVIDIFIKDAIFILKNEDLLHRCMDRAEIFLNAYDSASCIYCDDYWKCYHNGYFSCEDDYGFIR